MEEITIKIKAPDFADIAKNVAQEAANGAKNVVQGAANGAKRVHQAFGGEYGDIFEGNVTTDGGKYILPEPMIDDRECEDIDSIARRYEKMTSPGILAKASELAPAPVKEIAGKVGKAAKDTFDGLTEQELMAAAIKKAAEGFGELEKQAAKASVSKEHVIQCINAGKQEQKISDISEICLLRAYDIAAVTAKERTQHMGIAFVEGGGTGAAGFWGLPANLALSMLIYFRAVQSVAMFYGYDVKEDPAELVIASEVFQRAMSPSTEGNPATDYIGKVLVYAESAAVKQAAKKGWAAMIEKGGAALAITQMRALANKAAQKALEKGSKKAIEAGVFKKTLAQVGQKLTLKNVGRLVPVVGAGFGALFDTAQMNTILEFADLFYHKRFIVEKEQRVQRLAGQTPEYVEISE